MSPSTGSTELSLSRLRPPSAGQQRRDVSISERTEGVSLWRERGDRDFEHLGSTRTIYLAFQEADHYQDEIFVFDAIGGEALTFITRPPQDSG